MIKFVFKLLEVFFRILMGNVIGDIYTSINNKGNVHILIQVAILILSSIGYLVMSKYDYLKKRIRSCDDSMLQDLILFF